MSTQIKAVIFDMDGLIIDSEPLWQETYVERLVSLGVPRAEILKPEYQGRGAREFFNYWYLHYPWGEHPTAAELTEESVTGVEKLIREKGRAMPGLTHALELIKSQGIPMAVASSSALHLIEATIERLDIRDYFGVLNSGYDEQFAKPNPSVFIHTADKLGVPYSQCLVLEDSLSGVIAAKAAQMKCIAVPLSVHKDDPRFCLADRTFQSLEELNISALQDL